jgi:methionyl aminopeptidase
VVPKRIPRPPYADTGRVPISPQFTEHILIFDDDESKHAMRQAGRLARHVLQVACQAAKVGVTTDAIDGLVHDTIIQHGAYPSPLNYQGFPKSLCSSINEVICHGIPDARPLQMGDVVSFDVSCFLRGVHGDNCATVIVGDHEEKDGHAVASSSVQDSDQQQQFHTTDWRGVPYKTTFESQAQERHFQLARRLVHATRDSLYAGIEACKPGGCLSHVGAAIHDVADSYGFSTVEKYRGHGISHEFHCAPFVKVGGNSN